MAGPIVEGFSVSHACILDGITAASAATSTTWTDIYGVRSGRIAVNQGNFENTGDDAVLSSWFWFNYADVEISSGYISFETISKLTGEDATSGTGTVEMPLWTEASNNQPTRPMLIRVPSKTDDGQSRHLDFVLYKVQFHPFTFDGPDYKAGILAHYSGRALISGKDETGTVLPGGTRAIGKMISSTVA